jgi:hypothetical protein
MRRTTLALAAAVALGSAGLTTGALAFGGHGGGGGGHGGFGGGHGHGGFGGAHAAFGGFGGARAGIGDFGGARAGTFAAAPNSGIARRNYAMNRGAWGDGRFHRGYGYGGLYGFAGLGGPYYGYDYGYCGYPDYDGYDYNCGPYIAFGW